MVAEFKQRLTAADFEAFVDLPENSGRTFEFIGGEIVEVPSNPFASKIAMLIGSLILLYLRDNDIGHVTGEAGGYMVNGERYAPDVAFISYTRQPELAQKGYNPNPPELAVEVISDLDNRDEQVNLRRKVANYIAAGVVVWVVNPYDRFVEVYQPAKALVILDETGTLEGGDVLPGFSATVKDILPKVQQ